MAERESMGVLFCHAVHLFLYCLFDILVSIFLFQTEIHHDLLFDPEESSTRKKPPPREPDQEDPQVQRPPVDNQILKEFLDGSFCIEGVRTNA